MVQSVTDARRRLAWSLVIRSGRRRAREGFGRRAKPRKTPKLSDPVFIARTVTAPRRAVEARPSCHRFSTKSMLLRLATIAAVTAQQQTQTTTTFQQGAKKEWTFGDNQYKKVRDAVKPRTGGGMEDERWKLDDRSECYSGTDEYMLRSVFCDAECLSDNKMIPIVPGPGTARAQSLRGVPRPGQ